MVDQAQRLQVGFAIEDYRIERVLGSGGFGITYLARDLRLGGQVAIKEFFPGHLAMRSDGQRVVPRSSDLAAEFDADLDRFIEEARTLRRFSDEPGIVRVLRLLEANGTAYIVMDYLPGESLSAKVRRLGPLKPDMVRHLLLRLIDGLEPVHAAGFLHRDIKPGNILFDKRDEPVLIDFGAARLAMGVETQPLTAILTPGYAPIEQYSTHARQGAYTDIYGLAAVAHFALTGKAPPDAISRRGAGPVALAGPESLPGDTPLFDAVAWGLMPEERDRPPSITAWRAVLKGEAPVPPHVQRSTRLEGDESGDGGTDPEATRKLDRHVPDERTELVDTGASGGTADANRQDKKASPSNGLPVWLISGGAVLVVLLLMIFLAPRQGTSSGSGIVPASVPTPAATIGSATPVEMAVIKSAFSVSSIDGITYSPDGKRISDGGTIWDVDTGRVLVTLARDDLGGGRESASPAFSPDGTLIAVSSSKDGGDPVVRVYDAASGRVIRTVPTTPGSCGQFFTSDGMALIVHCGSASLPTVIEKVSMADGSAVRSEPFTNRNVEDIFQTASGTIAASATVGSIYELQTLDPGTLKPVDTMPLPIPQIGASGTIYVAHVTASGDGTRLMVADSSNRLGLIDPTTVSVVGNWVQAPIMSSSGVVALSQHGERAAVAFSPFVAGQPDPLPAFRGYDFAGLVGVWDMSTGSQLAVLGGRHRLYFGQFAPDGRTFAAVDDQRKIEVWRLP